MNVLCSILATISTYIYKYINLCRLQPIEIIEVADKVAWVVLNAVEV